MDVGSYGLGGLPNIAKIGFVVLIKRRGDTDDQGIHIPGVGIFVCGPKAFCGSGGNLGLRYAIDIRPAVIKGLDLFGVNIESGHRKASFIEEESQRQSDITEANDSYFRGMRLNASEQRLQRLRTGSGG